MTDQKLLTVDIATPNQNLQENLRRVKERYEDDLDEIVSDLRDVMNETIQDFCEKNPNATDPRAGIDYQIDTASIVFDMGNGESIYLKPVWIPTLYKNQVFSAELLASFPDPEPVENSPEIYYE